MIDLMSDSERWVDTGDYSYGDEDRVTQQPVWRDVHECVSSKVVARRSTSMEITQMYVRIRSVLGTMRREGESEALRDRCASLRKELRQLQVSEAQHFEEKFEKGLRTPLGELDLVRAEALRLLGQ